MRLEIIYLTNHEADSRPFLLSGIMTLPSSPCEIENMSLFQDLKLKRRKVDSRCSSDGKNSSDNILNQSPMGVELTFNRINIYSTAENTGHKNFFRRDISWRYFAHLQCVATILLSHHALFNPVYIHLLI